MRVVFAALAVMATPAPEAGAQASLPNSVVQPFAVVGVSTAGRWAEWMAVLTLVGVVMYRLFVLAEAKWTAEIAEDSTERARRMGQAAIVLFLITSVLRLMARTTPAVNAVVQRTTAVVTVVHDTSWGHGWLVGIAGAGIAAVGLFAARRGRVGWFAAGIGVVGVCLGETLTGHAGVMSRHFSLAVADDVGHILGAGGWLGGLVAVLLCGLPALRPLEVAERAAAGARLVRAFHSAALECVALVFVSGAIAMWLRLPALSDLWLTGYGRILLLKLAGVLVMLGFGGFHARSVVVTDWGAQTKPRFQRAVTAELLVGALVVALTAVLISTAPPLY